METNSYLRNKPQSLPAPETLHFKCCQQTHPQSTHSSDEYLYGQTHLEVIRHRNGTNGTCMSLLCSQTCPGRGKVYLTLLAHSVKYISDGVLLPPVQA